MPLFLWAHWASLAREGDPRHRCMHSARGSPGSSMNRWHKSLTGSEEMSQSTRPMRRYTRTSKGMAATFFSLGQSLALQWHSTIGMETEWKGSGTGSCCYTSKRKVWGSNLDTRSVMSSTADKSSLLMASDGHIVWWGWQKGRSMAVKPGAKEALRHGG
jgi:hypothetical protein